MMRVEESQKEHTSSREWWKGWRKKRGSDVFFAFVEDASLSSPASFFLLCFDRSFIFVHLSRIPKASMSLDTSATCE